MTIHMPYDQARYDEMKALQRSLEADAVTPLNSQRIQLQGRVESLPIYRFPTNKLLFNKQNGRIQSEVLAREAEEGRKLDPRAEQDQQIIKELLLAIRPDENEKISLDIKKNGQLQPGIVTCDGVVINGNRRKAILERLYEDTPDEKYQFIEVQVLPSTATKAEVWLIEAGIQMAASQQLDYSPINNLLKYREGVTSDITPKAMAARIYGATEESIQNDLERLDLIDEYLDLYLHKSGRYYLASGSSEHFKNLQNILQWLKKPVGRRRRDWDPEEADVNELKIVAFQYIRDNFPHMRIRELIDLFCIRKSWDRLRASLDLTADPRSQSKSAEPTSEELTEEEPQPNEPSTEVEAADRAEEIRWKKQNDAALKRIFESAKEQQQIDRDSAEPMALAKRALNNLEGIRTDSDGFDDPELDEVLGEVVKCVNNLRSHFMKARKKRTHQADTPHKKPKIARGKRGSRQKRR